MSQKRLMSQRLTVHAELTSNVVISFATLEGGHVHRFSEKNGYQTCNVASYILVTFAMLDVPQYDIHLLQSITMMWDVRIFKSWA